MLITRRESGDELPYSRSVQPASSPPSVRRLNAMDSAMLSVDRVLREMGLPDFESQAIVWLAGRADVAKLEAGLVRLGRRYPVIAARLDDSSRVDPVWRVPAEARVALGRTTLEAASADAVHEFAARQLAARHDPAAGDPMRFHLLHLPDGRDVLLMQFKHVLMDNNAAVPVLRELARLCSRSQAEPGNEGPCEVTRTLAASGSLSGSEELDDAPQLDEHDVLEEYVRRSSPGRRARAALRVLDLRFRSFRRPPVTLGRRDDGQPPREPSGPVRFHMTSAALDADAARRLAVRSAEICGLPSMSMALLAGALRAVSRHTPEQETPDRNFIGGLGVDLGLRGRDGPWFRNLMSVVPLRARWSELGDYEQLVRMLNEQFRYRLQTAADLGVVTLARFLSRRPRLGLLPVRRVMGGGYSLWYAYFGGLDGIGEEFCGTGVENVYFTAPTWPPMGLTLLVNQFRGRLHFQAISMPAVVPDETVHAFLEGLLADLSACESL